MIVGLSAIPVIATGGGLAQVPTRDASPRVAKEEASALSGVVTDALDGRVLADVQVRLPALARATRTDSAGRFLLQGLPATPVRLVLSRPGWAPLDTTLVPARSARDRQLQLALARTAWGRAPFELGAVRVVARAERALQGEWSQATTRLDGAALDRRLGTSIAGVVATLPGVTQRTNGPVAAQPVIRGLGGDRVAVLEDGLRTGDIATTAPDHAVTIEPLTARRIEVVRGPAGLAFGSNTLGGVVNVVREDVPRERPDRATLALASQVESVNRGATVSGTVRAPLGPLVVNLDANGRTAGDSRTPGGPLPFTDLDAQEGGVGVAFAGTRGYVGAAARDFRSYYGVPSSFRQVALPGSHEGGVYVDVRRSSARVEGELRTTDGRNAVRAAGNYVRFEQDEHERGGFVGTRFGQLAASGEVVARGERGRHAGAAGVALQWRDFRAEGSYTGTRPASVTSTALFAYDQVHLGRATWLAGARVDHVAITPLDSTETRLLRDVRRRTFTAATGSTGVTLALHRQWTVGATLARAFRPPAVEELFSAGPHLASYAYEVGNPSLRAERGAGIDLFVRHRSQRLEGEVTAFRNDVRDFVQYRPVLDAATGLPLRDPRLRRYVVYQASQGDARLTGVEGLLQWRPTLAWSLDGTASYVRGTARGDGTPLPAMPPFRSRWSARWEPARWFVGGIAEWQGRQSRIPAPPTAATASCTLGAHTGEADLLPAEFCPTPAALLVGATAGVRWLRGGTLHAVTLVLDNLFDTAWRDPLWRAKQVAPQPGRNVKLLYRISR